MTDDLVRRLRFQNPVTRAYTITDEAADRIEALEHELNENEIVIMRLKRAAVRSHRQPLRDAAVLEDMRQALRRNMIHNAQEARAALGEKKND